ncbi:GGDEF domain-containing protein [Vibrio sp. TBV020]|uniref:GGDEF domain-containing protein n=1 Tax=Vibrio sp. TBV020 TaxID=3137398 RepID=UPI0038CD6C7D
MIQSNGLFEFGQIELNERLEMLSLSSETHHQWKSKLPLREEQELRSEIYSALLRHFDKNDNISQVLGHFAVHQAMEQYFDILFNQKLDQKYIDSISAHALKLANQNVSLSLYSIIAFEFKRLIINRYSDCVQSPEAIDLLTRRLQLDIMLIIDCLHHKELEDIKRYASLMEVKDSLTDLYTYSTFVDEVDRIIAHCQRTRASALLLKVNIKELDEINKHHGYDAGNHVLQTFASATQDFIRKSDLLARGENDNFFLIMPDTGNNEAKLICERIIEHFELSIDIPATLRFGAVAYDPSKDTPVEKLLFLANEHLDYARDRSKISDKHEFSVYFPQANNVLRLIK